MPNLYKQIEDALVKAQEVEECINAMYDKGAPEGYQSIFQQALTALRDAKPDTKELGEALEQMEEMLCIRARDQYQSEDVNRATVTTWRAYDTIKNQLEFWGANDV